MVKRVFYLVLRVCPLFAQADRGTITAFAASSSNISAADSGRISRQANAPRQGQLALKLGF